MTNEQCQIAQLQELCGRVLAILEDENFFDKTAKDGFWHSSLYRDLKKASNGKEFKTFIELMKHVPKGDSDDK